MSAVRQQALATPSVQRLMRLAKPIVNGYRRKQNVLETVSA
ncbi:hypothetical protein SIL81_06435 [Xanthomonas campestris pv. incanae]|nr:hypothetical protein [Xanthomonas campestris]MCS3846851.1 hypothetical protein [Xanthomonas campestris]MDX6081033.1 hypothetical protein [Xanthomonas campestris pv. incanae]MDX6085638.1 hypothetical protein [Xanthomonas campestris pv. incanae]MDX6138848.1 hypothetical protein [Xanthomonas campestris pv. incanae]